MPLRSREGGSFLRNKRKQLNMTIEDAVRGTDLDIADVSRMENGRITSPSLDKIITYAKRLGLTPNQVAAAYGLWDCPQDMLSGRWAIAEKKMAKLSLEERSQILLALEELIRAASEDCYRLK